MTRTEQLNFELLIYDFIETLNTKDVNKLEGLSSGLHESIENVFYEFCMDNDIEDYTPQY